MKRKKRIPNGGFASTCGRRFVFFGPKGDLTFPSLVICRFCLNQSCCLTNGLQVVSYKPCKPLEIQSLNFGLDTSRIDAICPL